MPEIRNVYNRYSTLSNTITVERSLPAEFKMTTGEINLIMNREVVEATTPKCEWDDPMHTLMLRVETDKNRTGGIATSHATDLRIAKRLVRKGLMKQFPLATTNEGEEQAEFLFLPDLRDIYQQWLTAISGYLGGNFPYLVWRRAVRDGCYVGKNGRIFDATGYVLDTDDVGIMYRIMYQEADSV